jgi:hypothetical protein
MHKQLMAVGLAAIVICGCDDAKEGQPPAPDVTRPIQIDEDKPNLQGNPPQPPNNADTATSPGQNTPTTKPATRPAP